jgi:hypothetical protein
MHGDAPSQEEETLPMDSGLQGFGRGLYVSTGDAEGVIPLAQQQNETLSNINDDFFSLHLGVMPSTDNVGLTNILQNVQRVDELQMKGTSICRSDETNVTQINAMRKHLSQMIEHLQRYQPERTSHFRQEMDCFLELFSRYLTQKNCPPLDWGKVNNLASNKVIYFYTSISLYEDIRLFHTKKSRSLPPVHHLIDWRY